MKERISMIFIEYGEIDVLDGAGIGILRRGSPAGRDERFAGRVGHQVQVEIADLFVHVNPAGLLMAVNKSGLRPRLWERHPSRPHAIHNGRVMEWFCPGL